MRRTRAPTGRCVPESPPHSNQRSGQYIRDARPQRGAHTDLAVNLNGDVDHGPAVLVSSGVAGTSMERERKWAGCVDADTTHT